jgi:hypothetical protein
MVRERFQPLGAALMEMPFGAKAHSHPGLFGMAKAMP